MLRSAPVRAAIFHLPGAEPGDPGVALSVRTDGDLTAAFTHACRRATARASVSRTAAVPAPRRVASPTMMLSWEERGWI
eukprot:scaffold100391_cov56-Phaeocystis_antarctica.AAC.2